MPGPRHIVIVGQMGSGKTTTGQLVAAALGWRFRDNDETLMERTDMTAADVQDVAGPQVLHDLERQVNDELLAAEEPTVIAAPASIVVGSDRQSLNDRALVVWLAVSPELLAKRVTTGVHRPLPNLDREVWLEQLARERDSLYRGAADLIVEADQQTPQEVSDQVVQAFRACPQAGSPAVDLYWIPVGAGGTTPVVRWCTRLFELVQARLQRRSALNLYHAAMQVHVDGVRYAIEMGPAWGRGHGHGVVGEGPVGFRFLGRSRLFRYEVRRWENGVIPDLAEAVGRPVRVTEDPDRVQRILALATDFPTAVWGRDERGTGDMWNSNSLVSWLLVVGGADPDELHPPEGGRAPGWAAGRVVASRSKSDTDKVPTP